MGFCDPLQQPASVHVCCLWCTSVACVQVLEALSSYPCCSTQLNNTFHVVIGHHWAPSWQRAARRPADGTPGFLALACTSLVWAKSKSRDSARRGLLQPASARGALRQRCLWTCTPFSVLAWAGRCMPVCGIAPGGSWCQSELLEVVAGGGTAVLAGLKQCCLRSTTACRWTWQLTRSKGESKRAGVWCYPLFRLSFPAGSISSPRASETTSG